MTPTPQPSTLIFDWEVAGRELGASLDRLHAIAVLGSDDVETAKVALGIGRQQAKRRKVAIGDLLGEAQPLNPLVPPDAPGLSDVFEYGASVDKVATPVANESNLFILPSGAFISDHAEVMSNRRWSRLANGFREEKGLLIIASNVSTPEIENLVLQLDGAVLVGSMVPARLPVARVLGAVRGPEPAPIPTKMTESGSRPRYVVQGKNSGGWKVGAMVGVSLALVLALVGGWLAYRPFADSTWAPTWLRQPRGKAPLVIHGLDTAGVAGADSNLATATNLGMLTHQDSAMVAPYAIALVTFNTRAGALLELERNGATLRAGTFTPILIRETPWFRVVAGAYPDSASAAALLDTLRARGTSDAGRAVIEQFPYALLVERAVSDTAVGSKIYAYQSRGIPVYGLMQSDGTARLFAGAFKTPNEATLLFDALKASGVATTLVKRTGRVY